MCPVKTLKALREEIRTLRSGGDTPWREVANHFGGVVSHTTIQRIANGHVPSAETCRAMGVRKTNRYRMHVECGYGEQGRRRKSRVEAALAERGYENLTDYVLETLEVD